MRTLLATSVLLGPAPAALDGELAISAASLGELQRSPRARVMDLLIAATAAANGARLATRNARDLLGLEDLVDIVDLG
jgi:predicted nucleic acid-binding protein